MNLNQVTIYSNKVPESVEFYKKLGLRLIVDSIPLYARFICPDGNTSLSLHESSEVPTKSNIVLYFECKNLDTKITELKQIGLLFETEIIDQTWLWREVYLKDPNGNTICLFYAGENRLNPPWRVN